MRGSQPRDHVERRIIIDADHVVQGTLRDGTRSVSVRVPAGRAVRFRYLAPDGHWFDDPSVADRDGHDCVVRV